MTLLRRDKMRLAHWPFILLMLLLSAEVTNSKVQPNARNRREETDPRPPEKPKPGEQLGKYTRDADGKVTLDEKSWTRDYTRGAIYSQIEGACECEVQHVEAEGQKFAFGILIIYNQKAVESGCTVDLLLSSTPQAEPEPDATPVQPFKISAEVVDTSEECFKKCEEEGMNGDPVLASSYNSAPFVYGKTIEEFEKLKGGPRFAERTSQEGCENLGACKVPPTVGGQCMLETFPEFGWSKCGKQIYSFLHPVAEPVSAMQIVSAEGEGSKSKGFIEVKITDKGVDVMDKDKALPFPGKDTIWCTELKRLNLAMLKPWPVANEDKKFKGLQLFTIHLLPQSATRVHSGKDRKWTVQKDSPTGSPTCVGNIYITFTFPASFVDVQFLTSLGAPGPEPKSTEPSTTSSSSVSPTTSTDEPTTTASGSPTNGTTTSGAASPSNGTETTPETTAAAATEEPSSGWWMYLLIGVGLVALLAAVGVLVYCLCCRDRSESEDVDVEEAGEDEDADDEKGDDDDSDEDSGKEGSD